MGADAAHGDLAKRWCDSCHLVEGGQKQASADVPSFAAIAAKSDFSPEKVAYFLLDPHPRMPNFPLSRGRGHRRLYRCAAKIAERAGEPQHKCKSLPVLPTGISRKDDGRRARDPVAHHGPAGLIEIPGAVPCKTILWAAHFRRRRSSDAAAQDLPFIASWAADITSPVMCFMCSPALVNWLRRNSD